MIFIEEYKGVFRQASEQVPDGVLQKWVVGASLTQVERDLLNAELKKWGIDLHHYEFSGVKGTGTSRRDACAQVMERIFQKTFNLLKKEFGSAARFETNHRPEIDFYWRKARLALTISGPYRRLFRSDDGRMRQARITPDSRDARLFGSFSGIPKQGVQRLTLPYYVLSHNPQRVLSELRTVLVNSGAYPKLKAIPQ